MPTNHSATTARIEGATGLKIHKRRIINTGAEHLVVEVNDDWIFRLPRQRPVHAKDRKQWNFLASFATVSPIPVPDPVYVTDDFVGYRKIVGTPLSPTQIETLNDEAKERIAKQLGGFLATLHHHRDASIDFDGSLVLRHGYHRSCPEGFEKYLTARERRNLDAKLEAIVDNPANFVEPTAIVHGDLYVGNILWDKTSSRITGIIDWTGMGLGIPAMDFIGLADFTQDRNDEFLREMIRWYGGDEGLFDQVKQNVAIEVMNWLWCYEHRTDLRGVARTVQRFKRMLNA